MLSIDFGGEDALCQGRTQWRFVTHRIMPECSEEWCEQIDRDRQKIGDLILSTLIFFNVTPYKKLQKIMYFFYLQAESRGDIGAVKLIHEGNDDAKEKTLMSRWRYPSLSIHGMYDASRALI